MEWESIESSTRAIGMDSLEQRISSFHKKGISNFQTP